MHTNPQFHLVSAIKTILISTQWCGRRRPKPTGKPCLSEPLLNQEFSWSWWLQQQGPDRWCGMLCGTRATLQTRWRQCMFIRNISIYEYALPTLVLEQSSSMVEFSNNLNVSGSISDIYIGFPFCIKLLSNMLSQRDTHIYSRVSLRDILNH